MKWLGLVLLVVALMVGAGTVTADPGARNPNLGAITDVDCTGSNHDYATLLTVGLSPWFDPDETLVSPGPSRVELEVDGEWVLQFELPAQGIPTIFCTWTRGTDHYRGDVQFAPPI